MIGKILLSGAALFLALGGAMSKGALPNYVDQDENEIYGWHIVGNELNRQAWEFDENNNLVYCYAAEADTGTQRMYNYAIRNLPIDERDDYVVQATFTPDEDTDLTAERTHGIVCYYQNTDNYLIYWIQQKQNEWSAMFYGAIDGFYRSFAVDYDWTGFSFTNQGQLMDQWFNGEYYDMWWDQSVCTNSELLGRRDAIVNNVVTLKVESTWVGDVTRGGTTKQCRKYTCYENVETESGTVVKKSCELYVAFKYDNPRAGFDVTGPFYTGIYSEMFSFGVDYHLEVSTTDFAGKVAAEIAALPSEITSVNDIEAVEAARVSYETLLDFKAGVPTESVNALETAEASCAAYVDSLINALDPRSPTFEADLLAAIDVYSGVSEWILDYITAEAYLQQMVDYYNNPYPLDSSEEEESSEIVESSEEEESSEEVQSSESVISSEAEESSESEKSSQPASSSEAISSSEEKSSEPASSSEASKESSSEPASSAQPSSSSSEAQQKGGCGGSIVAGGVILPILALIGVGIIANKKRKQ